MSRQQERSVQIVNPLGFHARPAAEFVKLAAKFTSDVHLVRDDMSVNGKSIMGVLMLAAERGATLLVRTEGDDAMEAADALAELIESGFEESYDV